MSDYPLEDLEKANAQRELGLRQWFPDLVTYDGLPPKEDIPALGNVPYIYGALDTVDYKADGLGITSSRDGRGYDTVRIWIFGDFGDDLHALYEEARRGVDAYKRVCLKDVTLGGLCDEALPVTGKLRRDKYFGKDGWGLIIVMRFDFEDDEDIG